jgi:hypothetical protein
MAFPEDPANPLQSFSFPRQRQRLVCGVSITINVPLILKVRKIYFFTGKTLRSGQFRGQKVFAPSKNPKKCPIRSFAPGKKK